MTAHPITQHESIRDYLATLDPATVTDLAAATVAGVASAGALAEWTSETIENVLRPLLRPIADAGLPPPVLRPGRGRRSHLGTRTGHAPLTPATASARARRPSARRFGPSLGESRRI